MSDSALASAATFRADALVVATEWDEFRNADLVQLRSLLRQPIVFDGRNIYDPETTEQLGFTYYGIGRSENT